MGANWYTFRTNKMRILFVGSLPTDWADVPDIVANLTELVELLGKERFSIPDSRL